MITPPTESRMPSRWRLATWALVLEMATGVARADAMSDDVGALLSLSLEDLAKVEVTATSRAASRLGDTPASVFVIHQDEIRALGIRSLPEALRLAPNLHVAQINASSHAVSARGFKTSLSNKLLVLVDGRPIYTPLFAGVLWDMQAVPMEEIDRIEVVSGPGAAAWGANAVNGVINIVTRAAGDTSGGLASAWVSEDGKGVGLRESFRTGMGALRLYAKRDSLEGSKTSSGQDLPDGWTQRQAGFRANWQGGTDAFQLQGDAFRGESSLRPGGAIEASGYNLVGRWNRTTVDGNQWSVQGYVDVVDRLDPVVIADRMAIAALEMVRDSVHGAHHLTWGLGYRHAQDESSPGARARLVPNNRTLKWGHAFLQDQVALGSRLTADLGVRLDSNIYTGIEILPTARLALRRRNGDLAWGAVSRAVRSPARFDRDFFFPARAPFIIRGGPDFESETSNVAELGYRAQPADWLSWSLTGFHHWHDDLRGGQPAVGGGVNVVNRAKGRVYGMEGWATARMSGQWEFAAGFLELRQSLKLKPGFLDLAALRDQGNDPKHQILLRATRRLSEHQQLSVFARYVSALPVPVVPSYSQVDARWSFTPTDDIEVGIGVRNLFDDRHAELQPSGGLARSEFARSAHIDLRISW